VINQNDPVYTKQVVEILTVANEFCLFTEKADSYSKVDIITYYRRIIPLLYLKGSLVKDVTPENEELNERFVLEEDWQAVLNTIRNKLYPNDHFWVCADPHSEDTEPEKSSLGECIADCYQDMKDFLMLYQKNSHGAKENAVHELCQNFIYHFGPALTKALYGLHLLVLDTPAID
jgi:hypothetical protein